jgi:tRNA pseudouridine55 synthase
MSSYNGVLPIDKPVGPTSHDAVAIARRSLRTRRIGHTGTLDPFASGLLLLCLGPATRLAQYFGPLPKSYSATMRLGVTTETDDLEGEPLRVVTQWEVAEEELRAALAGQQGAILQVPPRYSAKKVAGERAYVLARRGEEVVPKPVEVTIHRIGLLRYDPPEAEFEVECSTGTYIRSIARDVGEALGVGAHLTRLRRTRIGPFSVDQAVTLDGLEDPERVSRAVLDPADAVSHLPRIVLSGGEEAAVKRGNQIDAPPDLPATANLALLSQTGALVAIAEARDGRIQPRKVFA